MIALFLGKIGYNLACIAAKAGRECDKLEEEPYANHYHCLANFGAPQLNIGGCNYNAIFPTKQGRMII